MSELRIALIAEGPTDAVIIGAALKALLGRPFILQTLQPEATRPQVGTGWCGVFKWCRAFAQRGYAGLEDDPTLPGFYLFVLHVDADVAEMSYADGGASVQRAAQDLRSLPCSRPCPPPDATADELRTRISEWLGLAQVGTRTVLCVPSKSIESWLAACVLPNGHALLNGLECNLRLSAGLAALPKQLRVRKTQHDFQKHAPAITTQWARATQSCTQAERFQREVSAAAPPLLP